MRTESEIREELAWLIAYKKEVTVHFKVIELSKHKYALLAAFYATIDHEIDLLRWTLGEDIVLWRDDMSGHIDMQDFFDSLPPSDFPWKPFPQSVRAAARKASVLAPVAGHDERQQFPCLRCGQSVCMASHNICGPCLAKEFDQDPTSQWADEAANRVPFHQQA